MARFMKVSRFENDETLQLPTRKTVGAAGYDFMVAEDTIVPSWLSNMGRVREAYGSDDIILNLNDIASLMKEYKAKPTLVPTGVKCELDLGTYLELSVRSSCPLKYGLFLANGVGIIDSDYYNNPSNEGEIFFQMINLTPFPIRLQKGDIIGQGIIKAYFQTFDEVGPSTLRMGGFGSTTL